MKPITRVWTSQTRSRHDVVSELLIQGARVVCFASAACVALLACSSNDHERGDDKNPILSSRSDALIQDSSKSGSAEGFYFLPPIVAASPEPVDVDARGALAADLYPVVRIDEIAASSNRTITTISRLGSPAERITVDVDGYHANWNTKRYKLDPSRLYRAVVLLDGRELGFADIVVTKTTTTTSATNTAPTKDPDVAHIVLGQTLPITFWLNACAPVVCTATDTCHGAGRCDPTTTACSSPVKPACELCGTLATCHVSPAGPTFTTTDPEIGGASLTIPPDAPPANVAITGKYDVGIGLSFPHGAGTWNAGDQLTTLGHAVAFDDALSPATGLVFAPGTCATMTLPFVGEGLLQGASPTESVRIYQVLNGRLELVPGSQTVDVAHGTVTACVAHLSEYVTAQAGPARGFYDAPLIWPSPSISVCWESFDPSFATERAWVRDQIERTWETQSRLDFTGWGPCSAGSRGIRIILVDRPLTAAEIAANDLNANAPASHIGTQCDGLPGGLELNFTFQNWQPALCGGTNREQCIRIAATHEFGHAIGLLHEQDRPDSTCTNGVDKTLANTGVTYGNFDANSIMNYCALSVPLRNAVLSPTDISVVRALYGAPAGTDVFFSRSINEVGGLFGARGNIIVGDAACPPTTAPPVCVVSATSSSGNCYVVGMVNPSDPNDCRCIVHWGVPALQGVSCIAEVRGTPPIAVCGSVGDPCCAGACNSGLLCSAGTCTAATPTCGGLSQSCCVSGAGVVTCDPGLVCSGASGCVPTPPPPPPPPPTCGGLAVNTILYPYDEVWSCDGRFNFVMQGDGNLVLYQGDVPIWASQTWGKPGAYAWMQGDGNLVVYDVNDKPIWASNTWGWNGASLAIQDDGNVVIYFGSQPIWATNTCCR